MCIIDNLILELRKRLPVILIVVIILNMAGYGFIPTAKAAYSPDNANKVDPLATQKQMRGNLQVGEFTGAAIYDYPLVLPPGRNGMTPSLSLTYNSQDSSLDSVAGYHWSLTDFSITRINRRGVEKLYDQNDFMVSAPFESGELLSLNLSDGHHGTYGQKYESNFARYEWKSDDSWVITDKQGTQYFFGSTSDARELDPENPSHIYSWKLEEVRDRNGNKILYSYLRNQNRLYPKEIVYSDHFRVKFLPFADGNMGARRDDWHSSYAAGFRMESNYLLTGIELYAQDEKRRSYEIAHTAISPLTRKTIARITESGYDLNGNETVLPPTAFDYTPSEISWEETSDYEVPFFFDNCYYECSGGRNVYEWDMTGDGLIDFEYYPSIGSTATRLINNGHGGWISGPAQIAQGTIYGNWDSNAIPNVYNKPIDFDGDAHVSVFTSFVTADGTVSGGVDVGIGDSRGFMADNGGSLGDLNGDGLPDIAQSRQGYGAAFNPADSQTCLNQNGNSCTLTDLWRLTMGPVIIDNQNASQQPRRAFLQDCNLDGLSDLYMNTNGAPAWMNDGKGGWISLEGSSDLSCKFNPIESTYVRSLDANGDGLLDRMNNYLLPNNNGPDSQVNELYIDKGNGSYELYNYRFPLFLGIAGSYGDYGVRIHDLNGDLLPDVIQSLRISDSHTGIPTDTKKVFYNTGSRPYFLKTVHTSEGGEIGLEYKTSAQYFKPDGTQANPDLPYIVDTVSKVTQESGIGPTMSTAYFYEDGHHYFNNSYDRESAGFRVVTKTDAAGFVTKNYYHQSEKSVADATQGEMSDDISKKGRPYRMEVYDNAGNLMKTVISAWSSDLLGSGQKFTHLERSTDILYTVGQPQTKATAKTFEYDSWGNVTHVTDYGEVIAQNNGSFSDTGADLISLETEYTQNTTDYLVALPSEEKTFDQNNHLIQHQRHFYDTLALGEAVKGNETKTEIWLEGENRFIASEAAYNDYGLPVLQKNPRGFETVIAYDADSLYPNFIVNPLGHQTETVYDIGTGNLLVSVDPNFVKTENQYDGLGRLVQVKTSSPGDTTTLILRQTIDYNDTSFPRRIYAVDYNDDTISLDAYTYLDGLGRTLETKKESVGGQWVTAANLYDNRGQMEKTLLPYFSASAGFETPDSARFGTRYTYDALGRVTSEITPVGTTQVLYEGWEKQVTDPLGNRKSFTQNARGTLTEVKEYKNADVYQTVYDLNPREQVIKITDSEGNLKTFVYDSLGRKTQESLAYKPAGQPKFYAYTYDDNGNLTRQTDPKNQTTAYAYDALDRITQEDFTGTPETELAYVYDEGSNAVGRLTQVTAPQYQRDFSYDGLGRTILDHKRIQNQDFTFGYTYDLMGAVKSMTYPDDSVAQYSYNSAHLLASAGMDDRVFADQFSYTPLGQIQGVTVGGQYVTANTYTPEQLYRLTDKTTLYQGVVKLQKYQYEYDAVGNLLKLTDLNSGQTGKTVFYEYDPLYRLTEARFTATTNNQNIVENYNYSPAGNMIFKSDLGTYTYGGAHPHAVTKIGTDKLFDYDENGNMTLRNGETFEYDYRNRLTKAGDKLTYTYGEDYKRLTKTTLADGNTKFYPSDLYELDKAREVKYLIAGENKIVKIERALVAAPTVESPALPAETPHLTFRGTKEANLALYVNGIEIMPAGPETTWDYPATLTIGSNSFDFYTRNEAGDQSKPVSFTIPYDVLTPSVNPVASPSYETKVTLTGTKRASTGIWINGTETVPLDDQTAWTADVNLTTLGNTFVIDSRDDLGQASAGVTLDIDYIATPPTLDTFAQPVTANPLRLTGSKLAGMAIIINEEVKVAPNNDLSWESSVTLEKGQNNFNIKARNEFGVESSAITLVIPYDTTAPTLDPLTSPTGIRVIVLSGTKPSYTSVWINGAEAQKMNAETVWGVPVQLIPGENTFTISTKDEAGLESDSISVTVVYDPSLAPSEPAQVQTSSSGGGSRLAPQIPKAIQPKVESLTGVAFKNLQILYKSDRALISWSPMSKEVMKFQIFRSLEPYPSTTSKHASQLIAEVYADATSNRFTDLNIQKGDHYTYQIAALNYESQIIAASHPLSAQQVYIKSGVPSTVDFTAYTDKEFSKIYISPNPELKLTPTSNPTSSKITSVTGEDTLIQVAYLSCQKSLSGRDICKEADRRTLELYVIKVTGKIRPLSQITKFFASLIPSAKADFDENQKVYYLMTDHLGSIDGVLDEEGNVVERYDYMPYGKERVHFDANSKDETDYSFTGKEYDREEDLLYYGARYYDPLIGRFIQVDPAVLGKTEKSFGAIMQNPQALNGYTYALNNPLRLKDYEGKYEYDVHYTLTYYLGSIAGLDNKTSSEIAFFDQRMDTDPNTAPVNANNATNGNNLENHFASEGQANSKLSNAISLGDTKSIGQAMHTFQDTYSHQGLNQSKHIVLALIAMAADIVGINVDTHPDKTVNDIRKAQFMSFNSFIYLRELKKLQLGLTDPKAIKEFDLESGKIYNNNREAINEHLSSEDKESTAVTNYVKEKNSK